MQNAPANDNTLPRPALFRVPGTFNPETGLQKLAALPPGAIRGPIRWPFPNDHREA